MLYTYFVFTGRHTFLVCRCAGHVNTALFTGPHLTRLRQLAP